MNADGINRKLATGEYIVTDKKGKAAAAVWGEGKKRKNGLQSDGKAQLYSAISVSTAVLSTDSTLRPREW